MSILSGSKVKTLREQKQWEQQDLARAAHVARSVISRLERSLQSDFKLSIAVAIATALGVTVDSLLEDRVQITKSNFTPELQQALTELSQQSEKVQNHAAGIVQGYLDALRRDGT